MQATVISDKKQKLIDSAIRLMLRHGYSDTSVDQICADAGVTKGSFFHYFASKEQICLAAMDEWSAHWRDILASAKFEELADPLDRVHRLLDVMEQAYIQCGTDVGCMVGTVAQEMSLANAELRKVFVSHFQAWVDETTKILADAKAAYPPRTDFDPAELAWWLQSFVQGTLLIAKSRQDPGFIRANIRHCRAYVDSLFGLPADRP
jgi:TetR/AcrR family transcriptional regulator, transcriptional repressor for nem operon